MEITGKNRQKIEDFKNLVKKEFEKRNLNFKYINGVTDYFYANAIICIWSPIKAAKEICRIYNLNFNDDLDQLKK